MVLRPCLYTTPDAYFSNTLALIYGGNTLFSSYNAFEIVTLFSLSCSIIPGNDVITGTVPHMSYLPEINHDIPFFLHQRVCPGS